MKKSLFPKILLITLGVLAITGTLLVVFNPWSNEGEEVVWEAGDQISFTTKTSTRVIKTDEQGRKLSQEETTDEEFTSSYVVDSSPEKIEFIVTYGNVTIGEQGRRMLRDSTGEKIDEVPACKVKANPKDGSILELKCPKNIDKKARDAVEYTASTQVTTIEENRYANKNSRVVSSSGPCRYSEKVGSNTVCPEYQKEETSEFKVYRKHITTSDVFKFSKRSEEKGTYEDNNEIDMDFNRETYVNRTTKKPAKNFDSAEFFYELDRNQNSTVKVEKETNFQVQKLNYSKKELDEFSREFESQLDLEDKLKANEETEGERRLYGYGGEKIWEMVLHKDSLLNNEFTVKYELYKLDDQLNLKTWLEGKYIGSRLISNQHFSKELILKARRAQAYKELMNQKFREAKSELNSIVEQFTQNSESSGGVVSIQLISSKINEVTGHLNRRLQEVIEQYRNTELDDPEILTSVLEEASEMFNDYVKTLGGSNSQYSELEQSLTDFKQRSSEIASPGFDIDSLETSNELETAINNFSELESIILEINSISSTSYTQVCQGSLSQQEIDQVRSFFELSNWDQSFDTACKTIEENQQSIGSQTLPVCLDKQIISETHDECVKNLQTSTCGVNEEVFDMSYLNDARPIIEANIQNAFGDLLDNSDTEPEEKTVYFFMRISTPIGAIYRYVEFLNTVTPNEYYTPSQESFELNRYQTYTLEGSVGDTVSLYKGDITFAAGILVTMITPIVLSLNLSLKKLPLSVKLEEKHSSKNELIKTNKYVIEYEKKCKGSGKSKVCWYQRVRKPEGYKTQMDNQEEYSITESEILYSKEQDF